MATVTGKTSLKVDDLLQGMFVFAEITPAGYLLFKTRGGTVFNTGTLAMGWDIDAINDQLIEDAARFQQGLIDAQLAFEAGISETEAQMAIDIAAGTTAAEATAAAALAAEALVIMGSVDAVEALAGEAAFAAAHLKQH